MFCPNESTRNANRLSVAEDYDKFITGKSSDGSAAVPYSGGQQGFDLVECRRAKGSKKQTVVDRLSMPPLSLSDGPDEAGVIDELDRPGPLLAHFVALEGGPFRGFVLSPRAGDIQLGFRSDGQQKSGPPIV